MFQGLTIEPLISPALWMTLAILSAALLIWYGRERVGTLSKRRWIWILSLTGLGMGAVLLILLNPIWVEPIAPPAGKPLLTILVDDSASMDIADAAEGETRFQSATRIAEALTEDLQSRFEVRIRKFAGQTAPTDLKELETITPEGNFTDLTGAITSSMTEDRPQGQALFLLSDGIHNGPGGIESLLEVLRTTKAMAVPVYTKTLGGDLQLKDLELLLNRPQELSFAGQNVPVEVAVKQRGLVTDKAKVSLLSEGKEIESHEVRLTPDATTNVLFNVKQKTAGLYRYEVRLEPLSQEATTANNAATLLLRVVQEPIRVLLLEGKPYWDGKFLMRTLAADPSLELDAVVKVSETRYLKRTLRLQPTSTSGNPD
ncbi:MAG: VWA domain-containing protein, partial [Planctomycetaceae bacterium]|nr:VWA domain-containing protein [Planctomycetaceae bacterium]